MNAYKAAVNAEGYLGAIDMGSNSFHLVVAKLESGEVRPVQKFAEKVMLGSGLNEQNELSDEAIERGLACLRRFSQRTASINKRWLRCVGTNTLRRARNGHQFIRQAEEILGVPVEVVSGREEARLVYLGVSHTLAVNEGRRLVFDIGGGSTEFIIGQDFEPILTESLHMGCVSYRDRFFGDGQITERGFRQAVLSARAEIMAIEAAYRDLGWESVVGSSGTVKAIAAACAAHEFCVEGINRQALDLLIGEVLQYRCLDDLDIRGVKPDRRSVFPSGLAILTAIFDQLGVDDVQFSDGALREGVLYDLLGRSEPENVAERSIKALMSRYGVDRDQAERVQQSALQAFDQVEKAWGLENSKNREVLRWAAMVHEVGLAISHSGFHKHGAYLLTHSDMAGFTRQEQARLACLVGAHRRKIRQEQFAELPADLQEKTLRLALLLRLAVILHRSRREQHLPSFLLEASDNQLTVRFPVDWLEQHPLTAGELAQEAEAWKKLGYQLELA